MKKKSIKVRNIGEQHEVSSQAAPVNHVKVKNQRFRIKYTKEKMERLLEANLSRWDPELCAIEKEIWSKMLQGPFMLEGVESNPVVEDCKRRFSEILLGFKNTSSVIKC